MKTILVTEPIHDAGMALLKARPDFNVVSASDASPAGLQPLMPAANGIIVRTAKLPTALLQKAGDLAVVSRHGVGCDNLDVAHLTSRGIPVAIAAGANSTSVAEHTLAMMLSLSRRLHLQDAAVRSHRWADRARLLASDLDRAHLLVVGFGRIGAKVARLARAFGMGVTVADIVPDRTLAHELGCSVVTDFHDALPEADFVSVHVPLDDSTRHMIAARELARLKPGAVLINCARGGIIADADLADALEAGKLGGAGIDVLDDEPPLPDDPVFARLAACQNVLMTPHTGAASFGAMQAMAEMAAQNVIDFFDGRLQPDCTFNRDGLGAEA